MPRKELRLPSQITAWLEQWGEQLNTPGSLILIGSGGILWHAAQAGTNVPLPDNSMDADPICEDENVAELCYEALIGSDFEKENGWHINLMPDTALREFRADWKSRSKTRTYGNLTVLVPSADDLLVPKLKRGEPRDHRHFEYAKSLNLLKGEVNL